MAKITRHGGPTNAAARAVRRHAQTPTAATEQAARVTETPEDRDTHPDGAAEAAEDAQEPSAQVAKTPAGSPRRRAGTKARK